MSDEKRETKHDGATKAEDKDTFVKADNHQQTGHGVVTDAETTPERPEEVGPDMDAEYARMLARIRRGPSGEVKSWSREQLEDAFLALWDEKRARDGDAFDKADEEKK